MGSDVNHFIEIEHDDMSELSIPLSKQSNPAYDDYYCKAICLHFLANEQFFMKCRKSDEQNFLYIHFNLTVKYGKKKQIERKKQ